MNILPGDVILYICNYIPDIRNIAIISKRFNEIISRHPDMLIWSKGKNLSLFEIVARYGSVKMLELIKYGAFIDIMIPIYYGNIELTKYLLSVRNYDPDSLKNMIYYTCRNDDLKMFEYFMSTYPELYLKNNYIFYAVCSSGSIVILKYLLGKYHKTIDMSNLINYVLGCRGNRFPVLDVIFQYDIPVSAISKGIAYARVYEDIDLISYLNSKFE